MESAKQGSGACLRPDRPAKYQAYARALSPMVLRYRCVQSQSFLATDISPVLDTSFALATKFYPQMASRSSPATMRNPFRVEPRENLWKPEDASLTLIHFLRVSFPHALGPVGIILLPAKEQPRTDSMLISNRINYSGHL